MTSKTTKKKTLNQILSDSILENPLFTEEFKRCIKEWFQKNPEKTLKEFLEELDK